MISSPEKGIILPDVLISAYSQGLFPMAEENGEIYWHSPARRAVIPLENTKVPRTVKQIFNRKLFDFTINTDFSQVIRECSNRPASWISEIIFNSYCMLHEIGYAHSVEARINGILAGGLYGVAIGGAFFGESMFTIVSNASKAAFYFLKKRLNECGFVLLDSQYLNEHTKSLGAIEIPKNIYLMKLKEALNLNCQFV